MNIGKSTLAAITAIGIVIAGADMAYAGDACKNVKFKIKNQRDARIRIFKVEYLNKANNKTQTENLGNFECAAGSTCTSGGENLRDSEGENLSNFVFFFNDQEADGGWSKIDVHTQPKQPVNKVCSADRTYSGNPAWTIN